MRWLLGIACAAAVLVAHYWSGTTESDRAYHARLATGSGLPEHTPTQEDWRDHRW
jgi:hypothetical protein